MPNNEPVVVDSTSIKPLINENESQIIFQRHCNYDRTNGGLISESVDYQCSIVASFINELKRKLENHYKDMQDMEFTIQEGKLYFLQTRNGKRTASAAINIACDLVDEGMITPEEAIARIDAKSLDQLLHPTFDAKSLKEKVSLVYKYDLAGVAAWEKDQEVEGTWDMIKETLENKKAAGKTLTEAETKALKELSKQKTTLT